MQDIHEEKFSKTDCLSVLTVVKQQASFDKDIQRISNSLE